MEEGAIPSDDRPFPLFHLLGGKALPVRRLDPGRCSLPGGELARRIPI